jgi:hypothetical protein
VYHCLACPQTVMVARRTIFVAPGFLCESGESLGIGARHCTMQRRRCVAAGSGLHRAGVRRPCAAACSSCSMRRVGTAEIRHVGLDDSPHQRRRRGRAGPGVSAHRAGRLPWWRLRHSGKPASSASLLLPPVLQSPRDELPECGRFEFAV